MSDLEPYQVLTREWLETFPGAKLAIQRLQKDLSRAVTARQARRERHSPRAQAAVNQANAQHANTYEMIALFIEGWLNEKKIEGETRTMSTWMVAYATEIA